MLFVLFGYSDGKYENGLQQEKIEVSALCIDMINRGGSRGGVEGVATPLSAALFCYLLTLCKSNRIKLFNMWLFHFHQFTDFQVGKDNVLFIHALLFSLLEK